LRIGSWNVLSLYRSSNGRCQEVGGEKWEEYCKEQGRLAEASEEGLGSKRAVVPMMMMIVLMAHTAAPSFFQNPAPDGECNPHAIVIRI
jgi:hypothetical protein